MFEIGKRRNVLTNRFLLLQAKISVQFCPKFILLLYEHANIFNAMKTVTSLPFEIKINFCS